MEYADNWTNAPFNELDILFDNACPDCGFELDFFDQPDEHTFELSAD